MFYKTLGNDTPQQSLVVQCQPASQRGQMVQESKSYANEDEVERKLTETSCTFCCCILIRFVLLSVRIGLEHIHPYTLYFTVQHIAYTSWGCVADWYHRVGYPAMPGRVHCKSGRSAADFVSRPGLLHLWRSCFGCTFATWISIDSSPISQLLIFLRGSLKIPPRWTRKHGKDWKKKIGVISPYAQQVHFSTCSDRRDPEDGKMRVIECIQHLNLLFAIRQSFHHGTVAIIHFTHIDKNTVCFEHLTTMCSDVFHNSTMERSP